ncbi:uncharacterized protein Bet3 [Dermacentor albipictus]|uniref:uncharacterized protein Bet3 n=1 Tax=Dermacentor albipictus TaxID=60249 RepID=UPI0031FDECE3
MSRQTVRSADPKKVSSELFTLTYGSLVAQMLKDYESDEEVNKQLDRMGYNIGLRLIEDFLARTNVGRCYDFRDTAEKLQMAFKMYLGISPSITNWSPAGDEFSLILESNPLTEFVELPESHATLKYSNIIPGVIRGALEMCFPLKQPWFMVYRNYEADPFFGLAAKCVRVSPTDVPYVDNATHVKVEFGDHDSLDLSVQLVPTSGYRHQNALRVSPTGGAQVELDLPVDYVDCNSCKILRHPYAGKTACSLMVTGEHVANPPSACHFIYRLFCGATKIPIYDESCKKHH